MSRDFVWNQEQAEQIRYESERAMRAQVDNMRDTEENYRRIARNLEEQASAEQQIANTAMTTETYTDFSGDLSTRPIPDWIIRNAAENRANSLLEQASLLRDSSVRINRAAYDLEDAIRRTNNLFYDMHEEAVDIDRIYCSQLQYIGECVQEYIKHMEALRDSFNFSFPMAPSSQLIEKLQAVMGSTILGVLLAARLAGIPGFCFIFGDPVNMATGNFIYEKEDLEIPGRFPLMFKRFYNAIGGTNGVLGFNWTHNYNIHLKAEEEEVHIFFGDGHMESYAQIDVDRYVAPLDSKNHLRKVDDDWVLVSYDNEIHSFNNDGELTSISDLNGNSTELTYENGLLTKVSNPCGHFEFAYNESEHLTTVTDHTGRKAELEYENNRLTKVTHPNGAIHEYAYGKKGLLSEVITPENISFLKNEYDSSSRMKKQHFPDGGVMEYIYDDSQKATTFIHQNGSHMVCKRDEKYRTTGIVYSDGEEKFEYDDRNNRTVYVDKTESTWKYEYDLGNNLTKATDPYFSSVEIEYNDFNKPTKVTGALGEVSTFEYDSKGNITKFIDPIERTTELVNNEHGYVVKATLPDKSDNQIEYDKAGNITTIIDASGVKTKYEYDNLNRVIKAINGEGESTGFEYNVKGDIERVTNALGDERVYEYNLTGKVTKITDFDGGVIEYKYNDLGKVKEITDQAGGVTKFTYDIMWNVTSVTDPCGNTVNYEYDNNQRIIRTIDEEGNVTNYEYDPNGNVTKVKTANGAETTISYDALNRQRKIIEGDGAITSLGYDKAGNVTKITDALGNETKREYDLAGQLIALIDPLGNKTTFTYSPLGQMKKVTNAKGESQVFEYYPGGRLKSASLPCGESETYEYDKNGNVIKVTDALSNETKLIYDSLDRVVEIINPLGHSKKFNYDAVGNITSITDELGNVTKYRYSLLGDVIEVIDAMGHSTKYDYDKSRRLTKFEQYRLIDDTLAKTKQTEYQVTTYERNKKGEVIAVTSPLGSVVKYGYDGVGNVISKLDEDNLETLYEYNIVNQLTKVSYADGKTVELGYNALKQLTEMKDWLGVTTIEVDELGRATKVTDYEGKEVGYSWSELNQKEKLIYPDKSEVTYEYNASGRLSKVNSASGITSYAYDQMGRITERILPDNTITKYETNPLGRLTSLTHSRGNEIPDSFKYSYDPVGNITQIDKYRANMEQDSGLFKYNYDPLGRLIEATNGNNTKLYNYDNLGNRISSIQNGVETRHSYNSRNQLIRTEGIDSVCEYSYDLRGNLTQITENGQLKQSFTFDATNMMVSAFTANKGNAEYTYNGFRNRVKKLENLQIANKAMPDPTKELRYTLDMTMPYDNLLMAQGAESQNFVWGNTLLEASGSHYYLQDHLGSPVRLLNNIENENNTALAYDEFGVPLVDATTDNSSNLNNPFGFTGYQSDDISGLYYAQARYYEPSLGRFGAEDIIRDGLNWYGYCSGNPIRYIDPRGLAHFVIYTGEGNNDFSAQAEWKGNYLSENTNQPVYMIEVNTAAEFIAEWNNMAEYSGRITSVSIFSHGTDRSLNFASGLNNAITVDGLSMGRLNEHGIFVDRMPAFASVNALNPVNVSGSVHLYSCNAGHLATFGSSQVSGGHNFASALSTRVLTGSVIGYDGAVAFGSSFASPIFNPIFGNWLPRLSNSQTGFHDILEMRGFDRYSREPLGPQQFVQGQLDNDFRPGRTGVPLWFFLLSLLIVYREEISETVLGLENANFRRTGACE